MKSHKNAYWRKYKGSTPEELCAAIRELWLAKAPNYIRLLNEVPNKLIQMESSDGPKPSSEWTEVSTGRKLSLLEVETILKNRNRYIGRQRLKELEKFLDTHPYKDHFYADDGEALEDEIYWMDPDAPLSEYVEADKKRDAIIKRFSV